MEWDDLRYVLAVHRAGSLAGAARALNISHVTVFRRIESIEKNLGVRLFDRKRQGYVATPVATDIVQQAEQVEDQVNALERRIWRRDSEVHGTVRLTTTDTISMMVLPGILARLRSAHPQLVVENIISHDTFNITKRDADIAIRHTMSPPEMLIGHCLTKVRYAVYGGPKFARRGRSHDLSKLPWVAPDDSPSEYRFIKWLRENGHEPQVVMRCNSFVALAGAVKAGVGVGILSCFTADSLGGLARLTPVIPEVDWQYWILTHPELRDVARVATVYGFLRKSFTEMQPLFLGETSRKARRG
jgi:DNA-binding transcriptional LysR family regulator